MSNEERMLLSKYDILMLQEDHGSPEALADLIHTHRHSHTGSYSAHPQSDSGSLVTFADIDLGGFFYFFDVVVAGIRGSVPNLSPIAYCSSFREICVFQKTWSWDRSKRSRSSRGSSSRGGSSDSTTTLAKKNEF